MGAHELCCLKFLQLIGSPVERLVAGIKEMKSADCRIYRSGTNLLARVGQCVDEAGMAAACQQNETAISVEDERLIVGDVIFDPFAVFFHLDTGRVILLGVSTWHRTGQPYAGKNLI